MLIRVSLSVFYQPSETSSSDALLRVTKIQYNAHYYVALQVSMELVEEDGTS